MGILKQDGKLLVDPPSFQSQFGFSGGFAGVKIDGKWGILDSGGLLALAPQFDEMQPDSAPMRYRRMRGSSGLTHQDVKSPSRAAWRIGNQSCVANQTADSASPGIRTEPCFGASRMQPGISSSSRNIAPSPVSGMVSYGFRSTRDKNGVRSTGTSGDARASRASRTGLTVMSPTRELRQCLTIPMKRCSLDAGRA